MLSTNQVSWGLLRDSEPSDGPSFQALVSTIRAGAGDANYCYHHRLIISREVRAAIILSLALQILCKYFANTDPRTANNCKLLSAFLEPLLCPEIGITAIGHTANSGSAKIIAKTPGHLTAPCHVCTQCSKVTCCSGQRLNLIFII